MRRGADSAGGRCAAALLLAAATAQASRGLRPDAGLADARGRRRPAGCWWSTRKAATWSARRRRERPRPLASNMKLFTTATALSRLGPESRDPHQGLQRRPTRRRRRPPRQPLPAGRRRPDARHAGLLQQLPGRPRHQPLRAGAADPRRRDHARSPAASTPTTRSSTACAASPTPATRPAPTSARSPASPSTPASAADQRSGFSSDPAKLAAAKLARSLQRRGGRRSARRSRSRRRPPDAERVAVVRSPTLTRIVNTTDVYSDNFFAEMLIKLLGARLGGAGTTAAGAAVVEAFARGARLRRPRGRRLRPDPLQPRLAAPGGRPAAGDARRPRRRRIHPGPGPGRQGRHRRRPHARHRRLRPLPDQDRHPDRRQQPLRLLLQHERPDDGLLDPDERRRRPRLAHLEQDRSPALVAGY